jgi:endoglucanase
MAEPPSQPLAALANTAVGRRLWAVLAATLLLTAVAFVVAEPLQYTSANLAGGDFLGPKTNVRPKAGTNFVYPSQQEIVYFSARGRNVFRYPFRWETLQAKAGGSLVPEEVARLKSCVKLATGRGRVVLLDPHNSARFYGQVVGTDLLIAQFADFWRRLAIEFANDPLVWFGLVNEPHGMPTRQWFEAAQATIDAIREAGADNMILVPGNAYSGAHSWTADWYGGSNAQAAERIKDPLGNWAIELHQYLDADSSGTKPEVVRPKVFWRIAALGALDRLRSAS